MTKILYIGFGVSPFVSGGAVLYQESIIKACNAKGFEILCFYSAPRYQLLPKPTPFIREWYQEGLRYIELVNPPHHFGHCNDPRGEGHHPVVQKITDEILDIERPDLVHIHELQQHAASVISALVDRGIPVIKTMHNYYDLCPQRDLMFRGETLCEDFEGGTRCLTCLEGSQKNKLHLYYPAQLPLRGTFNSMAEVFYRCFPKRYAAEDYAWRRQYFVAQLNRLTRIHCSSQGSASILEKYGVNPKLIEITPITTENTKQIRPKPLRDNRLPVTFGFMGGLHCHKGYEVLLDAFARLDQSKAKLLIWNTDKKDATPINGLNIECRGRYLPGDINFIFQELDVCLIPSLWHEIFGLIGIECLMAKIPVIGSDIGGIPQWLNDGQDGFLVKPGDSAGLAETMDRFVQEPALISQLQKSMRIPPSFDEHIEYWVKVYEKLIACR